MNWGKGIVTVLILFMAFIITLAVFMFTAPDDDYDHQYYEKGLSFNRDYDQQVQVYHDHAQPVIGISAQDVTITFAQPVANGNITFSRPSDSRLDKTFSLKCDAQNKVVIPRNQLLHGKWQLAFGWESNHKKYMYQKGIYLK